MQTQCGLWDQLAARAAICVVAAMAAWGPAGSPANARDFRVADTQAENYPTVQALLVFGRLIDERTGGRHHVRVFHSRQLGEEKETIEQTRVGVIDLNRTNVAPLGSFVPEANILALPFLFRSVDHLHRVLDGPVGDEILTRFGQHGFVGLTFYDSGARSIYNAKRPIRSPEDMRGLRIRVQQSQLMVDMIKALGAEPVELAYGQVLTALSTRLIDGAENNWPSYVTTGHFNAARYYSLTEHTMGPEVLVMSKGAWESLSPGDQRIFRDAARESAAFMRRQWLEWEQRSREQARRSGNEIVSGIDKSPFDRAMAPIYDATLRDPRLKQLVERIRQVQ